MTTLSRREKEKLTRETEVIKAAEKVFALKGYEEASMDEIAKEAQFTKRTVYQYFINKEDLFFAVSFEKFKRLLEYLTEEISKGRTGFEKVQHCGLAFYKYFNDFPDTYHLLYTGHITPDFEMTPHRKKMFELKQYAMQELAKVIKEGQADGSIRSDLDAKKTAFSLIFILNGYFYMLAESGKSFTSNFQLNQDEFIIFSLDLLWASLRAKK